MLAQFRAIQCDSELIQPPLLRFLTFRSLSGFTEDIREAPESYIETPKNFVSSHDVTNN